jgi:GDP-mannose 6-dehydrogenase
LLGKGYELSIYDPNVIAARLTGANKQYINGVIPHLSRLLVPSLDELRDAELLIIGHHFEGVDKLLENTNASIVDLAAYEIEVQSATAERELVPANAR